MSTNKLVPALRFPEFVNEGKWEEKVLGSVCDVTNGKANVQDHIENGKYPLFDRSEQIKASNEFIFDCEAVIIPGEGMRFIPKYYEGKFNLHQRAYALKDFNCNGHFVYYSMLHRSALLSQKAVQSTVLSLRLPILQNFPIEIPKKPDEQQKIAACLSSLDELITAHNQKLELLKSHKKGLMQNLFPQAGEKVPKYRFKEFENDGEWVEKKLGEVIELLSGYAFQSQYFSTQGKKLITPKNFTKNGIASFTIENTKYTSEISDNKYWCKEGDLLILITDLTPSCELLGKPVLLKKEDGEVLLNQRIIKVIPQQEVSLGFLLQFFLTDFYHSRIKSTATGSTVRHSSNKIILETEILLPFNFLEQQKIASCLSAIDTLITAEVEKIAQLQLHKKGLMQGLFPRITD